MPYEIIIERISLFYSPHGPGDIFLREPDGAAAYRRSDDLLWKGVMEDLFGDFLHFFFPAAASDFDLERGVAFLDKELDRLLPAPGRATEGVRFADKLARVFLKDGSENYLLVHVEIQAQKGKEDFAQRMFRYWYRIRDKYRVPVTALAILIDSDEDFHPRVYREKCLDTELTYVFNTYKVLRQNEDALLRDPNPFALVVLTALKALKNKGAGDGKLLDIKRGLLREMLARDLDPKRRKAIFNFMDYTLHLREEEAQEAFEQEVNQITERSITMGTEEFLLQEARLEGEAHGVEQGRLEGKGQFVKYLIEQMGFSDQQAAETAKVSLPFVREIRKQLRQRRA